MIIGNSLKVIQILNVTLIMKVFKSKYWNGVKLEMIQVSKYFCWYTPQIFILEQATRNTLHRFLSVFFC